MTITTWCIVCRILLKIPAVAIPARPSEQPWNGKRRIPCRDSSNLLFIDFHNHLKECFPFRVKKENENKIFWFMGFTCDGCEDKSWQAVADMWPSVTAVTFTWALPDLAVCDRLRGILKGIGVLELTDGVVIDHATSSVHCNNML